jgi:hypothetical protein
MLMVGLSEADTCDAGIGCSDELLEVVDSLLHADKTNKTIVKLENLFIA